VKICVKLMLLLPVITFGIGCGDGPPPHIPATMDACDGSCVIFEHYDCPEFHGSMDECVSRCKRIAKVGYLWVDDSSGPQCVVKAQSLGDVRACNVRCKQ